MVEKSWGGKRPGAGRPKGSTKPVTRKQRSQMRATDEEWELIKAFEKLVKSDGGVEKARKLLEK